TGGSGDQGIDGLGLVKLNDVVSLNIVFQCKRYKDSVAPHHVRDFRGAMQGRGEKGLIITTGRFTKEAKNEANRDGVTPIELIDGERLVELFEKYQLGLRPITVYEIDNDFFKGFN
ncbi:MAG: restriction endonuclease, partial [Draconibacterium sp.]